MWDPVPWFVGGGAQHSPEIARTFAYAATSGAEGIIASTDLRVAALSTPGSSVRVLPGAALILNRSTGGAQQTYAARVASEDVVGVAAQGASGTRYDLVVARVEDPFVAGTPWADPTDPAVGPYVFTRIIPNVPSGTTTLQSVPGHEGESGIALARIAIPANTATITDAMITDLRKVARPRRTRDLYNTQPTTTSTIASSSWTDWTPQANRSILVPSWATQVKVIAHVASVAPASSATLGVVRFALGSSLVGQQNTFDLDASTRATLLTSDTLAIPASYRGTSQVLKLQAARSSGAGNVKTDTASTVVFDVEFLEVASTD